MVLSVCGAKRHSEALAERRPCRAVVGSRGVSSEAVESMNTYSYQWHEMAYLALAPARACSDMARLWFNNPINPLAHTQVGRNVAASAELFERLTRRYGKPIFGLNETVIGGKTVPIHEEIVWQKTFCKLLHFSRGWQAGGAKQQQKLLIVAPMSGHHATLLRGTVEAFLPF